MARVAVLTTIEITLGAVHTGDLTRCGIGIDPPVGHSRDGSTTVDLFAPGAVMASGGLVAARQEFEKRCIEGALTESKGNVSQAARLLGIDRTNLHKKIQAYGLGSQKGEES